MKAMIFAAGLGTRLKPFTDAAPKALVPVGGKPLLEILIRRMQQQGVTEIIVNVHHFAAQVKEFLLQNGNFGMPVAVSDESGMLLDTGGGLMKASWFFADSEPFLVHNVDVISDVDFRHMRLSAQSNHSLATLAVSRRRSSRYLLFDSRMQLCGWENAHTGEVRMVRAPEGPAERFAFSGIHVISPAIFPLIQLEGKFSMIDVYLSLAAKHSITGFLHSPENWVDVGKPDMLAAAEEILHSLANTEHGSQQPT